MTAILRLADISDFSLPKPRLIELARERAAKDSESDSWKVGEAAAVEESAETEPQHLAIWSASLCGDWLTCSTT
jgi:hypothetical protein